ncbi:MAG: ABC transporter permease [Bacteroidota bacterium]
MNKKPPKYAQKFLHWFLKPELEEEVLGDLAEKFEQHLTTKTTFRAKVNYWYQTLNYLRPFAVKNNILTDLNPFFMLNSYFKIARRSLFKQKLYSVINVIGMTIGMTCFLLIALYVQYELSYDLQHEKADRIYRVVQQQEGNTFRGIDKYAVSPMPIAPTVRAEFPEVEAATMIAFSRIPFKQDHQTFYELGLNADTSLFDVFTYPVIEGDVKAAIKDKDAVILTEKLAKKYFGYTSPIGKTIEVQDKRMLVVKAVIEDIPKNQHFGFDFIWAIENDEEFLGDKKNWRWSSNNYRTYLALKAETDVQKVEAKMMQGQICIPSQSTKDYLW